MNVWLIIYRGAWVALAVIAVIAGISMFMPKLHQYDGLASRKAELQQANQEVENKIADIQDSRERFASDPAFLEHTARESGMIKSNEVVLRFTNATPLHPLETAVVPPVANPLHTNAAPVRPPRPIVTTTTTTIKPHKPPVRSALSELMNTNR